MNPVAEVDQAFAYIFLFSAALLFGITATMIYFVIRYRRSRHPQPADIRDNWKLETVWVVLPTLIALSMFMVGWKSYTGLRNVPAGAMQVQVYAQQFSWIFIYDNGKESENILEVPANTPVKVNVQSLDVIHSFYVPAFRIKIDALKNFPTYAWFHTEAPGEFDIICAEYCGLDHSLMRGKIKVVPKEEFDAWLNAEQ